MPPGGSCCASWCPATGPRTRAARPPQRAACRRGPPHRRPARAPPPAHRRPRPDHPRADGGGRPRVPAPVLAAPPRMAAATTATRCAPCSTCSGATRAWAEAGRADERAVPGRPPRDRVGCARVTTRAADARPSSSSSTPAPRRAADQSTASDAGAAACGACSPARPWRSSSRSSPGRSRSSSAREARTTLTRADQAAGEADVARLVSLSQSLAVTKRDVAALLAVEASRRDPAPRPTGR